MKKTSFISTLVGVVVGASVSMLVASSALADRRYHDDDDGGYHHRQHGHYGHHRNYEARNYEARSYVVRSYEVNTYDDNYDRNGGYYGRVMSTRPIYRTVAVDAPRDSCHVETYAHQEYRKSGDSFGGTVMGGLVGAAIGHELGNGRGDATAVGGLIGASIGNDASKGGRVVRYRDEEVCSTHYRTEYQQQLVGYDVSYSYLGRIYQTRTDRFPGDRIAVAINVRSRDY